jgi:hypothetical protein
MCRPSTSRLFFWHKSHDPEPPNSLIPILHSKNKYVVLVLLVLLLLVGAQQSGFSCCVALCAFVSRSKKRAMLQWVSLLEPCLLLLFNECLDMCYCSRFVIGNPACIRLHSVAFGCIRLHSVALLMIVTGFGQAHTQRSCTLSTTPTRATTNRNACQRNQLPQRHGRGLGQHRGHSQPLPRRRKATCTTDAQWP